MRRPKEKLFTAFCQAKQGHGTIWIESISAYNVEEAIKDAQQACAEAWEYDVENIHVLGIALGNVEIAYWEDIGDD